MTAPASTRESDAAPAALVSIIVPCRNERAHVQALGAALQAQRLPPGWSLEAVVADGASDDGTRECLDRLAAADARLRVVDNPERLTAAGLNRALAAARGSVIVRWDVHTRYADDYVAECLEALARSGADNVGGPWRAAGEGGWPAAIAAAFRSPWVAGGARSRRLDYEGPVDTVYLGAWPRRTFERFGPFDAALGRNQDDEHNLRIVRGGGRIWQSPRIRSAYQPRGTPGALARQWFQYGYWKAFVRRKHGRSAAWRHLVPGLYVGVAALLAAGWLAGLPAWLPIAWVGAYAAVLAGLSVAVAAQSSWALLPRLPVVIAAQQLGYGAGSLLGAWDAGVRGGARERLGRLTR